MKLSTFFILFIVILLFVVLLANKAGNVISKEITEDKVYININGEPVEFVIDDYENPFLKYNIKGTNIYIPYPFITEEDNQPDFKNEYTVK